MDFGNVKEFMDRLTAWRIPGNSIVVYHKNREVFRYGSGYASVEQKTPMSAENLVNIYSCSKVATVTAALQLYEKGLFLLDDPLCEYIPQYKKMYVKDESGNIKEAKNPITLRHLFTHTAGFSYDLQCKSISKVIESTGGKAPTLDVVKAFAEEPLLFEPGEHWRYSFAHDVLGGVVEVISGKKFSDYVKENIFEPIGVKDIYYHHTDDITERMAEQYKYKTEKSDDDVACQICSGGEDGFIVNAGKKATHELGSEYDSGGAGITVSVADYAVFGNTLANKGFCQKTGERILTPNTVELLRTNQLLPQCLNDVTWSQLKGYGYGLGVRTLMDRAKSGSLSPIGEFGWGGAAGATLLVDCENELSYFYAHHMLNPQEDFYQPRLRNVVYSCF